MRSVQLHGLRWACALLIAVSAVGCGGGGGGDSAGSVPPPASGAQNSPPTIQGQPSASVVAGQSYSFQPTASDADGNTLTFSASNLPAWASLDASTGKISGTPTSADVATYNGITMQVSDGKATASLGPFSIAVVAMGTGAATLSWTPPTQNTDGSTLTDLAGYKVLYGRSATDLTETIAVSNPSVSTYVVENLSSGTWYFAVVTVNAAGVTSLISTVASKSI